ncbi:sigma-54-dependent transcriptional regulator [Agitococcus lubricus]|uniref:Two-component response regulator PilR n=1 Tax=Agitococcus lubricus TaxID=1077255 RepID=A0A2T5J2C1_9GAMM|nr:sigma-54 dependent transcriptional regulator [Agitococcus lubricus]PTQ90673.1 two-component response regulator PilR [Agitococcus lubricus]
MKTLALIIDDEPDIRELLEITLERMDIECRSADGVDSALALLKKEKFQLCLTDMHLPDGSGLEIVQAIQKHYPHIPVAVITAYGSMDMAVTVLKAGAFDFVSKPIELSRLRDLIRNAVKVSKPVTAQNDDRRLLGSSDIMNELRTTIRKLARSQAPVYISGESGTGKEVVARLIHDLGPRAEKPFIPVNCGAIPSELMESEFFGHKKGSFTGATEDKLGLFQVANEGTLFLDEVADLPLTMQVKLLRAIQEKTVRPIGAAKEIAVNIRLLSATHKDLAIEVAEGRFRQDLFYRINVIQARIPPLRDRGDDIIELANSFLAKLSDDWGLTQPKLHPKTQQALKHYSFPGNVRELQNILERALTLCEGQEILPDHLQLPEHTQSQLSQPHLYAIPTPNESDSLEDYLLNIEKNMIIKALDDTRWNRTAAAKKLGMTFRSLRYRLKKLGLDDGNDEDENS